MLPAIITLVAASLASAQWHSQGHAWSSHAPGSWDRNGGYPHGNWGLHTPGGQPQKNASDYTNSTFDQLIDHKQPHLGTFKQFYYYDTAYWKGPGSPVILFTPGEVNATRYYSYLTTNRTTGLLAEKIGAATIVLEHRYWGTSTPFANLTTENLQYLTLENAIKDMTYFANEVKLPFAKDCSSNAQDVPWVTMGGSYSGALSAWIASVDPGTYWAYHSSSAPLQAIGDYWAYFEPVQQGMPKNCSKDLSIVIDHMDDVLIHGTENEVQALKAQFGLEALEHNGDFMAALENGPWLWQGNQFYQNTGFFEFCDYVENSVNATSNATGYGNTSRIPGAEGVGVEKALAGLARWWNDVEFPGFCEAYGYFEGKMNTECLDTYNASNPLYTDTSLSNTIDRQWIWMTCNEPFGYFQTGAPADRPSIVSRLVDREYYERQCGLWFPDGPNGETYGLKKGKTYDDVNAYTGGWHIDNTTRLIYVNGDFDPWREVSVSADSDVRPGGPLQSTNQVPIEIVPGGFHTSDLITQNGKINPECKAVQDRVIDQLASWVAEWPKERLSRDSRKPHEHGGPGKYWQA